MEDRYAAGEGIRLHYVEHGSGSPVVLLHGFPDYWYSWRKPIPAIASAGYRAIAVDLRGYNLSDRPGGIAAYKIDLLVKDIVAFIREITDEPPTVIGHDWGGVVAWYLAMQRPECMRALAVLNAPHPVPFRRELRKPSLQPLRSSYAAFFQVPKIPEAIFTAGNFAVFKRALRSGPADNDEDLTRYIEAFSKPHAISAALNYYRAATRYPPAAPSVISLPTLLLWGDRDPFLGPALTQGLEPWIEHLKTVHLPDAGHWLHHTHADAVNQTLVNFLRGINPS